MGNQKQIFYHTGLSKTASTFLQKQVFPYLKDIEYIPTVKYRKVDKEIDKCKTHKILVSREFDQQFEKEVRKFAMKYPNAKPIIVLREHGSWITSQYKRFIKNGHYYNFSQFIDLKEDKGRFKKEDLSFQTKIDILEEVFHEKPLVLLFDELKENPKKYIEKLLEFMNAKVDWKKIDLKPNHQAYNEHSLKFVRRISKHVYFEKKLEIHRKPLGFTYNFLANGFRYSLLYGANLIPKFVFDKEILVAKEDIESIRQYCQNDWDFVKSYVKKQVYANSA